MTVLAALPMLMLVFVLWLELHDGEFGLPAVVGSLVATALGPAAYWVAKRYVGGRAAQPAAPRPLAAART